MSDDVVLRPDIAAAWDAMPDKTFTKQSVRTLEERLDEGETVAHLVGASMEEGGTGLLVLTGRRLFFYAHSRHSLRFIEVPWRPGHTVSYEGGWVFGKLRLIMDDATWEFHTAKTPGMRFADALRTHVFNEPHAVAPSWYAPGASDYTAPDPDPALSVPSTAASPEEAIIAGLERLGELHERGILDEDEFRKAKADLLARLSER